MTNPLATLQSTEFATDKSERRRRVGVWLLGALVLVLLAGLVAQQLFLWSVVPGPERPIEALTLLALSSVIVLLFVIIAFILVRNLLKLRRERREGRFGSRLKTRLVTYFIALSLLPITVMALFSYTFLNRSLEKWFGGFPQDIVVEARRAQEKDGERARRSLVEVASLIAAFMQDGRVQDTVSPQIAPRITTASGAPVTDPTPPPNRIQLDPNVIARDYGFAEVLIVANDGGILARAGSDSPLGQTLLTQILTIDSPAETLAVNGLLFDVARVVFKDGSRTLIVARVRSVNQQLVALVQASERFEQLRSSQRWVRGLGLTTLALLTLLLLFALTWTANHLARSIVLPLRKLAEASDEIARGNLAHRVSEIADDELAALAASFNMMTAELEENRGRIEAGAQELNAKNLALDERRAYIETVLATVSTGVVSLDEHDRVTTINLAARLMLRPTSGESGTRSETSLPVALGEIACVEDVMSLERVVRRARRAGRATEQTSLVRASAASEGELVKDELSNPVISMATIPVALSATALRLADESDDRSERCGVVLVMEDLTELIAAQRAAAWSEVARRMAHEIKNPLTPIQLSAERIARQFKLQLEVALKNESDDVLLSNDNALKLTSETTGNARLRRIVEEGTETITREVASLKSMVDEFSRFAQLPGAQPAPGDLNEILRQAIALYEERLDGLRIETRLAPSLPVAFFDYEQIRRVFVNLLENATESVAAAMLVDAEGERRITIATAYDARRGVILAEVADNGHGIRPSDYPRLFQPYFSTRNRGTGLGLAIVHRIITDHGGRITVEPNYPCGARFRVEIPVAETELTENQKSKVEGHRFETSDDNNHSILI